MEQLKAHPTVGVCGLDCGLCPRFYTVGTSRCPGCGGPGFADKHPSCSFITCCVKKRGLEACGQCPEFPCSKFKSEGAYRRAELSAALLDPKALKSSLDEEKKATAARGGRQKDTADKAKVLRGILAEAARSEGIELTARK